VLSRITRGALLLLLMRFRDGGDTSPSWTASVTGQGAVQLVDPPTTDLAGKQWTKPVPPEPHRPVANADAALEQQVFQIPQRQGISHVHHHHEPDHLGRRVEVAERINCGLAHAHRYPNAGSFDSTVAGDPFFRMDTGQHRWDGIKPEFL